MDIIIKSYNRAYYLDRCLFSIQKYVKNNDGKIIVLDDGTPDVYLRKISDKYPYVIIKKSDFYEEKIQNTSIGKKPESYKIPIDFWVREAKNASDNFLLIEDDTWFVHEIDLFAVNKEISENKVMMTKLYWMGNDIINQNKQTTTLKSIILLKPKLYTIYPPLYYAIFYKFDRFKIRKILKLLKINTLEKHLAYYCIYAVAGMIFNRDYFTSVWKNHKSSINEGLQLYNAVKFYYKNRSDIRFAKNKQEVLKTGFISAATNQQKEYFEGNIDMFQFNLVLNEEWLVENFDVMSSLPKDISAVEVIKVLKNTKINPEDWIKWSNDFKKIYLDYGSTIE